MRKEEEIEGRLKNLEEGMQSAWNIYYFLYGLAQIIALEWVLEKEI